MARIRKLPQLNPSRVSMRPLAELSRLVKLEDLARPLRPGATFGQFLDSLPAVLAAGDLRELARRIAHAHRGGRTFLLMAGAHPIEDRAGPAYLRDAAGRHHKRRRDERSRDHPRFRASAGGSHFRNVGQGLKDGSLGMAEETGAAFAADEGRGLGEIVGREMCATA